MRLTPQPLRRFVNRARAAVPRIPDAWRTHMSDVTRRQTLKLGLAGTGAALLPLQWAASASAVAAPPPEVTAGGDLALWYDRAAGNEWLRALPIGNGRLGAMVFGNVDTEQLQLNEDTVWAGGPYDA